MNESSKNKQCNTYHSLCQRHSFAERLGDVWQDIQSERHWKYEKLSPVQLLQKSELHRYPEDNDELARANWFWRRRPRFLQVTSCIVWLIAALGLPIWLFIVPAIGMPLLIVVVVIVNTEIVRSVRWRRQYELSIDRLVRTSTNGRDTFGVDIFA
jgi:Flp pilus assembly protein TadB